MGGGTGSYGPLPKIPEIDEKKKEKEKKKKKKRRQRKRNSVINRPSQFNAMAPKIQYPVKNKI